MERGTRHGWGELGYRHMLVIVGAAYILIIAIPSPAVSGPVRVAVLSLLLGLAVRARRLGRRWLPLAIGFGSLLLIATVVAAAGGSAEALIVISSGATALLVAIVIVLIGRAVLRSGIIDASAVRAVLCVYLLIALLFASLYQFFAVFISPFLNGTGDSPNASEALYFSVITMATVGYGDITPISSVARALVVAEALLGQLYLVSVVAAVVGRYRREGSSSSD